jgi:rubrerythrin
MEKFIKITRDKQGVIWWMCTCCGEKLRYKPMQCPICGSKKAVSPEVENAVQLLQGLNTSGNIR